MTPSSDLRWPSDGGAALQERILRLLLDYEGRLEAMEIRNEQNCRVLAFRIAELVRQELQAEDGQA